MRGGREKMILGRENSLNSRGEKKVYSLFYPMGPGEIRVFRQDRRFGSRIGA